VFFIREGGVRFYEKTGSHCAFSLPEFSFFGEYQVLHGLRCTFVITAQKDDKKTNTFLMCVKKKDFKSICDQFPNSKKII
jgi:hypothetical protein